MGDVRKEKLWICWALESQDVREVIWIAAIPFSCEFCGHNFEFTVASNYTGNILILLGF